jgi:hypothetical protein
VAHADDLAACADRRDHRGDAADGHAVEVTGKIRRRAFTLC